MGVSFGLILTEDAMLESYFAAERTLTKLRSGVTGPFIDEFAKALRESGYARQTGRVYLREVRHLGAWMELEGVALASLDEDGLDGFSARRRACACLRNRRYSCVHTINAARLFLKFLRQRNVTKGPTNRALPETLERFEHWMRRHRGVVESTLEVYRRILFEFVESAGDPATYTAVAVRGFISERAARTGVSFAKLVVTAVRMFLRYLATQGLCSASLTDAVPTIARWRLSSLPVYLLPEDVERLVRAPASNTPVGQRDRAILLLLARLGLRAGDVRGLCLDHIDWKAGTVLVTGKGRRPTRLPLPQEVGDAILRYLTRARPRVNDEHVSLRGDAPYRPFRYSSTLSAEWTPYSVSQG